MTPSDVFSIANTTALPMWLLMIVLPKWKVTRFLIDYKIIPLLLAIVYAIYIVMAMLDGPAMDFGSLESVMALFTSENAVVAGWVHYLVFDMLVGMWILDQNNGLKLHPIIMAPCLILTFMLGPVGFILFMSIRAFRLKTS